MNWFDRQRYWYMHWTGSAGDAIGKHCTDGSGMIVLNVLYGRDACVCVYCVCANMVVIAIKAI